MGKVDQKASHICSVLASYEPVDNTSDLTGWLVCFTAQRIHTYVRPEGNTLPLCVKFEAAQYGTTRSFQFFIFIFTTKRINKLLENTQPTKKILYLSTFNLAHLHSTGSQETQAGCALKDLKGLRRWLSW